MSLFDWFKNEFIKNQTEFPDNEKLFNRISFSFYVVTNITAITETYKKNIESIKSLTAAPDESSDELFDTEESNQPSIWDSVYSLFQPSSDVKPTQDEPLPLTVTFSTHYAAEKAKAIAANPILDFTQGEHLAQFILAPLVKQEQSKLTT